jgi:hypothetical protein
MLAGMDVTVATLRALDALHGLARTDAELEAARPAARRAIEMLASLDATVLDSAVEPTTQFRIL